MVLGLLVMSISGCTAPSTKTYSSKETLTITISTTYAGNYSVWIPTLWVKTTEDLPPVWTDLRLTSPNVQTAHLFSEYIVTDKGHMEHIEASGSITLVGHHNLSEGKCCSSTEDYTQNRWGPLNYPSGSHNISMPAKAALDPPNNATVQVLHIDILYNGKSDYCGRNDHVSGDVLLNGSWSYIIGEDIGSVCSGSH